MSKIKDFLASHQNIQQVIKFTFYSIMAFLVEFGVFYALQYGLAGKYGDTDFKWFLFNYEGGKNGAYGLAGFIAFLVSKCIAEIIAFTLNRKKTFEANNNAAFSAVMYALTVVAIILLSTWLGGALGKAIGPAIGADWGNTIGKLLGSFLSWVIMFLMDKFVIMRKHETESSDDEEQQFAADGVSAAVTAEVAASEEDEKKD